MTKKASGAEVPDGRRSKIDWIKVEQDYVTGYPIKGGELYYPSLADLAEKYGVEKNTVAKHSMKKLWVQKREDYQELIRKKATEKKAIDYATEIVQFSKDMFHVSKALKQIIMSKVFITKKDDSGKVIMSGYNESLNTLEMRRISEVAIMVQTIQKNTVDDINTRKERTSIDDLVDMISDIRTQYIKENPEEDEADDEMGELHPDTFIVESDL